MRLEYEGRTGVGNDRMNAQRNARRPKAKHSWLQQILHDTTQYNKIRLFRERAWETLRITQRDWHTEKATLTKWLFLESRMEDVDCCLRRICMEIQAKSTWRIECISTRQDKTIGGGPEHRRQGWYNWNLSPFRQENIGEERLAALNQSKVCVADGQGGDYKSKKRDMSTRRLGIPMDTLIRPDYPPSPSRRRMLAQAQQLRKDHGYKYNWLRNGNILLRKEKNAPMVDIRSQSNLSEL